MTKAILLFFLFSIQFIFSQTTSTYDKYFKKESSLKSIDLRFQSSFDKIDDSINKINIKNRLIREEEREQKRQIEIKKNEKEAIAKYGLKTYDKLKAGYYWVGMTRDMAIIALGHPIDVNETVGSWGLHEQWVYNDNIYLYFENDKLTSYQR
jgi:hypothetical protein